MRLWTIHPKYLDVRGLVALWREALLVQAVLSEQTRGYRNHPQLERFKSHSTPLFAISSYLAEVHAEGVARGYRFDSGKIGALQKVALIPATTGQRDREWEHLLEKLKVRSPELFEKWRHVRQPDCHSLFQIQSGPVASWERAESPSQSLELQTKAGEKSIQKKSRHSRPL